MKLVREATRGNFRKVEKEWQWEFVFWVLHEIGIQDEALEECLPESGEYADIGPKEKLKIRRTLDKENITIVDNRDGGLNMYVYISDLEEHVLIASWKKCSFVHRENIKEVDFNKRFYVEVHADIWTSFEEEEDNE